MAFGHCTVCGGSHRLPDPKVCDFPDVEDIHPSYCAPGFIVTNEKPSLYVEFLKDMKFRKVVSICSGGELPLLVLLPRVTGELVAVDHSYRALAVTIVKAQMLLKYGAETYRAMFASVPINSKYYYDGTALQQAAKPFIEALPSVLQDALQKPDAWGHKLFCSQNTAALVPYWKDANTEDLERSIWAIRAGKLRLVHGDLTDVVERGPFDLFYISNAHEHVDRDNKKPNIAIVDNLVRKGGYILASGSVAAYGWTSLQSGFGKSSTQYLYQKG